MRSITCRCIARSVLLFLSRATGPSACSSVSFGPSSECAFLLWVSLLTVPDSSEWIFMLFAHYKRDSFGASFFPRLFFKEPIAKL